MDDKTKTMMLTLAAGIIKKGLIVAGTSLAGHGVINSNQTETFVSVGMVLVGLGWSFWNDYGRAIVLSQLEVLKAKSLAQAAKMTQAGVTPVTTAQIAAQSPTMGPTEVAKVVATLPEVIQANVQKALILAIAGIFLGIIFTADARAQVKLVRPTGNFANDIAAATGAGQPSGSKGQNVIDSAIAALAKPFQDIAAFIGEDADQAVSLSTAIPEIQDGHGQQCWMALASFGKIIQAHPVPLTFHVMNDFETLRLLAIATNRLCANVHCTQVFADGSAMAQSASPVPLLVPTLHDLCTKVPQIALVDPVPPPVVLPAPAATKP